VLVKQTRRHGKSSRASRKAPKNPLDEPLCGKPSVPLSGLEVSSPQLHQVLSFLGAGALLHQGDVVIQRHPLALQPFDRNLLDHRVIVHHFKALQWGIDPQGHQMPGERLLDRISDPIDFDTAIRLHTSSIGLPMDGLQPGIRVNHCWKRGQTGEDRMRPGRGG
jgi:hypothetical protein